MKYIFGYGSLMNNTSLALTLPGPRTIQSATLKGYQRSVNVPYGDYLYMNIVPNKDMSVEGVLIEISDEEFGPLKEREAGYDAVDVSESIESKVEGAVIAFIAPDTEYPKLKIPQSYLATCMRDLPESKKHQWLKETILKNEIVDDLRAPVYENAAL